MQTPNELPEPAVVAGTTACEPRAFALKELKMANDNLRFYANQKMAETTIFIAIRGGLLTALFNLDAIKPPHAPLALKLCGIASSLAFLLILESTHYAWFHLATRAAVLERTLGFKLWSSMPGAPDFNLR